MWREISDEEEDRFFSISQEAFYGAPEMGRIQCSRARCLPECIGALSVQLLPINLRQSRMMLLQNLVEDSHGIILSLMTTVRYLVLNHYFFSLSLPSLSLPSTPPMSPSNLSSLPSRFSHNPSPTPSPYSVAEETPARQLPNTVQNCKFIPRLPFIPARNSPPQLPLHPLGSSIEATTTAPNSPDTRLYGSLLRLFSGRSPSNVC